MVEHACHASTGETGIEDSPVGDQLQKETLFPRKKRKAVMNVLPAILGTHRPSPATSSPKTEREAGAAPAPSCHLPPFPPILVTQSFVWG